MIFAIIPIRNYVFFLTTVVLSVSSCQYIEPVSEVNKDDAQRVVIQQEYAGYTEVREISQYSQRLSTFSKEALEAEVATTSKAFQSEPTTLNGLKNVTALVYDSDDEGDYDRALSLLGDIEFAEGDENTPFWRFYTEQLAVLLKKQTELIGRNQRLVEERETILKNSETLEKELQVKTAELAKVQNQLDELKSIEESILERDIVEDVGQP